jgi:manganese/iron transport system permease protein
MRTLVDSLGSPLFRRAVLETMLVGALAGTIGVHVLLRRLPFFVVAMSHATFPGVVIGSVLGVSLFLGGATFGLVVVAAVIAAGTAKALDDSTTIGVVLAGAFAVGVLVQSAQPGGSRDLAAFLVGSPLTVTTADVLTTIAVGSILLAVVAGLHKELVFGAFDRSALAALGYPVTTLDAVVLVVVTLALVVSVPAVGTLLAVALLTVPAIAARQWTDRVGTAMVLAALLGAASGFLGLWASALWDIAAGAAVALAATALLLVSVLVSGRRRSGPRGRTGARTLRTRPTPPRPGSPRRAPAPAGASTPSR